MQKDEQKMHRVRVLKNIEACHVNTFQHVQLPQTAKLP